MKTIAQTEDEKPALGLKLRGLTLLELYQWLPESTDHDRLRKVGDMDHEVEPVLALVSFGSNQMLSSLDYVFRGSH